MSRPTRIGADLVLEARRRAGLSQGELAARLGRDRATIARWEAGRNAPSLEAVRELLRACGLELTVGVARFDDSYDALVDAQLSRTPPERLAHVLRTAVGLAGVLAALARHEPRYLLAGRVAAALHGAPSLIGEPELELVPADDPASAERLRAAMGALGAQLAPAAGADGAPGERWRLSDGSAVVAVRRPFGTRGYDDLRRDAELLPVLDGFEAPVVSLLDLIRIADASPRQRADIPELRATRERAVLAAVGWRDVRTPEEIVAGWRRRAA